jgi:ferredoxin/flavodoxin
MKTVLYYFSGTGNTLMLARMLADELGNTEIINIVSCSEGDMPPQADAVGILFPVYAFGMPRIMYNFVEKTLQTNDSTYVFSLTNYAGAGGATALKQLKNVLKAKNICLHAGFGLKMPANYIPFGGAESLEKQDKLFSNAASMIQKFAGIIKEQPKSYFYKRSIIPMFFSNIMYKMFMRDLDKEAKKFYVNSNCTSCGICATICPTDNITLTNGVPVWGDNCEQCLACLQWCPEMAIHRKGVPETRTHYHNPNLTANDLIKDMKK